MTDIPSTSTTLLRQISSDSRHARWVEFVARYTPMCRRYAERHFPSLEADDLLQETFAAVAKALPDYRYDPEEKGHFRNYLTGILRNKAFMALRSRSANARLVSGYAKDAADASASLRPDGGKAEADWEKAIFEIALRQLLADPSIHDRTKRIFVRAAIRQESPEDIAKSLGVSRNLVDQQKRRMLAKFRSIASALKEVM